MKLLLPAATLLCVLAGAVAGPALSAGKWRPTPQDFELAPRPGTATAAVKAPKRFNLVGMRWRGGAEPDVELRVRKSGGRWSRWAHLAAEADHAPDPGRERSRGTASAPLWVGDADYVQYRLSRPVPGLRLHFVNVRGTATAGERARTALRTAAGAAAGAVAGLLGANADAQSAQPGMVSRSGWGASSCPPRAGAELGEVKAAHIHHTVSLNDYTPEEAPGIVLSICRYHRNSNGWNDIGYNFLVDKYGVIYEGRAGGVDQPVVGAQAQGFNSQTTGISNIGDYSSVSQSPAALDAMARLIRWKLPLHGAPTAGSVTLTSAGGQTSRYGAGARATVPRILGHRDTNSTACPGNALYAQLPDLRARVGGVAPVAAGATRLTAALASKRITAGAAAPMRGVLTGAGGGLAGEPVQVQVRKRGRWVTTRRVRTGAGGTVEALLKPRAHTRVRLRYPGRPGLRASASRSGVVRVRARVALSRAPRAGLALVRMSVRGSVAPAKRRVYLVLQVRRGGRWRGNGTKAVATRRGRFATTLRAPRTGAYRYYVVARADRLTDRGRSPVTTLRVGRFSGGAPSAG